MDEYISREAVVRYLKGYSEKELNSSSFGMITSSVLNKAERAISEMPAADVQPVNRWILVKDRLPERGTEVLVTDGLHTMVTWCEDTIDGVKWVDNYYTYVNVRFREVTHWQYLPEPPESEDDAE